MRVSVLTAFPPPVVGVEVVRVVPVGNQLEPVRSELTLVMVRAELTSRCLAGSDDCANEGSDGDHGLSILVGHSGWM